MDRLTGLRTLLVRPQQGQDIFAERLMALGATLFHCPVMQITSFAEAHSENASEVNGIKPQIQNFDQYQIAIFISRTAARLGMKWLSAYWPDLPEHVRYYAVGKSTAALLLEHGIEAEVPEQAFSSEGLIALPSLQNIVGEQAMIFAGEGGRSLLAQTLENRGAIVSKCDLYRREATTAFATQIITLLADQSVDLVIVHSGELLVQLIAIVPGDLQEALVALPVLVPSERVADMARSKGFSIVICAGSALPDSMVSALTGWYSNQQ